MTELAKDTEQLILEAAVKEFAAKGFDGARTATIAAEAGVTHAMLHYYFRTKEKLFERIFKDKIELIGSMIIAPLLNAPGGIRTKIRKAMEAHFNFLMANRELPLFFVTTLNSRPELYDDIRNSIMVTADERKKAIQEELNAAARRGEICYVDAAALLADIGSLNVMPFLAYSVMMPIMGYTPEQEERFFVQRKMENIKTILKRLS